MPHKILLRICLRLRHKVFFKSFQPKVFSIRLPLQVFPKSLQWKILPKCMLHTLLHDNLSPKKIISKRLLQYVLDPCKKKLFPKHLPHKKISKACQNRSFHRRRYFPTTSMKFFFINLLQKIFPNILPVKFLFDQSHLFKVLEILISIELVRL